jgi:2-methylcitrate dehydratase PrpD
MPRTTEEAQYSLSFPVAAALVFGRVGATEVDASGLEDSRVARIAAATIAVEDIEFSRRFPAERWARVRIALSDGRQFVSQPMEARGGPDNRLTDDELSRKYRELAEPVLGPARTARIEHCVGVIAEDDGALRALLDELLQPVD